MRRNSIARLNPAPNSRPTRYHVTISKMPMITFPKSSFFVEERAAALPSPGEIRSLNEATGDLRATYIDRPIPVVIPSLKLLVKYGTSISIAEIETQIFLRKQLQHHSIPIPEVFGYAEEGDQIFLYMALVEGETLQQRFASLNETERRAVCAELKSMVQTWRQVLTQSDEDLYIGSIGKRPLTDIFLGHGRAFGNPGPFIGLNAWEAFHKTHYINIQGPKEIVFTHNDLCPPNIHLSKGPNPRVKAIIDFGQSGWYPWYWEYCKARTVGLTTEGVFEDDHQEEWHTQYLPLIMDPVDNEKYFYPWKYFMLARV